VKTAPAAPDTPFSGARNLEVMTEARNYNAFVLALALRDARPGLRVLDFGAGSGTFAREVARSARPQRLVCVELDPLLRAQLASAGLESTASIEAIAPGTIDYAYSLNVLEHIEDDEAALASLHAALAPGASLFLYVPAFKVLWSPMDTQVGHLRRYRRAELRAKCERAGFVVESATYVDSLGFLASLWLRAFGDRSGQLDTGAVRFYDRFLFPLSRVLDAVAGRGFGKNVALRARKAG
jgi:SAM-dependent methyltransferase